jgi:FMN phosphatase YigB (HAD superfamily)
MFDWTGTLVDEHDVDEAVCKEMERELSRRSGITLNEAEKKYRILLKKFEHSWKWFDYPLHGRMLGIDWRAAQLTELTKIRLIPNAREVLEHFRNKDYFICLLTNAVSDVIEIRMNYLRMRPLFDMLVTSDLVRSAKASGKHIQFVLDSKKEFQRENFCMIGDDLVQDILPAKKHDIVSILCKFGDFTYYHTNANRTSVLDRKIADYAVTDIKELPSIIESKVYSV